MGLVATFQHLGIIALARSPTKRQRLVSLGSEGNKYEVLGGTKVTEAFCAAFAGEHMPPITCAASLGAALATLTRCRERCPAEMLLGGTYVWPHLVRKLVLAGIRRGGDVLDWGTISKATFESAWLTTQEG